MINIDKNKENVIIIPLYESRYEAINNVILDDTIVDKDTIINGILSNEYVLVFGGIEISITDVSEYVNRYSKFILDTVQLSDVNEGQGEYKVFSNNIEIKRGVYKVESDHISDFVSLNEEESNGNFISIK